MVDEQYLFLVNDEDGDGEINFFVDVGHEFIFFKFNHEGTNTRRRIQTLRLIVFAVKKCLAFP